MEKLSFKFLFAIMLLGTCLTSAIASQGPWDWVENYG